VQAAQAWLTAEFDGGRQTSVEWEELAPQVSTALLQETAHEVMRQE
jgi:hypothetical protein